MDSPCDEVSREFLGERVRKLYPKRVKAAPEYLENETVIRDEKLPKYNYIFNPA